VIRLLRWTFWLAATFALVYFAATVPLGSKTLLGHLRAIAQTKEARELGEATRDKAEEVAGKVRQELTEEPPKPAAGKPAVPARPGDSPSEKPPGGGAR